MEFHRLWVQRPGNAYLRLVGGKADYTVTAKAGRFLGKLKLQPPPQVCPVIPLLNRRKMKSAC